MVFPSPIGSGFQGVLAQWINHPLMGTEIDHYRAEYTPPETFNQDGNPDYLAQSPGQQSSGIVYTPNPDNSLRAVFCPVSLRPIQDQAGIYYQGDMQIFLLEDLGEVYQLNDDKPKRQDKFIVQGQTFYASSPAFPCQQGSAIAAWQIYLARERYPVTS